MGKPKAGTTSNRVKKTEYKDDERIKKQHLRFLKRNTAILTSADEIWTKEFKVTSLGNNKLRVKGVGVQAVKLALKRIGVDTAKVLDAVLQRNWKQVQMLVPYVPQEVDYKVVAE